ncbi:MAG: hypothetical protein GC168_08860 [Candidatus Hydrogenedens sp.]|nr:hypothetical protein [Candidatus Hydrogenedens sp.]
MAFTEKIGEKIVLTLVGTVTGALCTATFGWFLAPDTSATDELKYKLGQTEGSLSECTKHVAELTTQQGQMLDIIAKQQVFQPGAALAQQPNAKAAAAQRGLSNWSIPDSRAIEMTPRRTN